jgi:hypothetical protein
MTNKDKNNSTTNDNDSDDLMDYTGIMELFEEDEGNYDKMGGEEENNSNDSSNESLSESLDSDISELSRRIDVRLGKRPIRDIGPRFPGIIHDVEVSEKVSDDDEQMSQRVIYGKRIGYFEESENYLDPSSSKDPEFNSSLTYDPLVDMDSMIKSDNDPNNYFDSTRSNNDGDGGLDSSEVPSSDTNDSGYYFNSSRSDENDDDDGDNYDFPSFLDFGDF